MTGSIKLAALFAGAMLILVQGVGTAQAGHGHKEKAFDSQRGNAVYGAMAYKNGKAYGKRGKLRHQTYDARTYWGNGKKKAYGKRAKLRHQAYDARTYWGDGKKKAYRRHARRTDFDTYGGRWLTRDHRAAGFFQRGDDGGFTVRRGRVNDVVLRRGDETRRVRVASGGFVRRRSTDGFDTSGLSCGTSKRVVVMVGRRVKIGRRVCRDANGEVFAVAGTQHVIRYLDD